MKQAVTTLTLVAILLATGCQTAQRTRTIGCATCIFDMPNVTGCKLAVKIDGTPYLVDGSGIDDHGDAHASDGLCLSERQAVVKGAITNGRFAAQHIQILERDSK